ncbi:hypothetical protein H0H93_014156 [Arthromyces matolae]|nr:hypothetical protein H0H93_014156 [Arthromyces matolae]
MSRAPPFPTRRSPSVNGNNVSSTNPLSPTSVRPLQISRPTTAERSLTPANAFLPPPSPRLAPPNAFPVGPARPQRSELRSKPSDFDNNSEKASYRDSISTTRSDVSLPSRPGPGPISPNVANKSKHRPQRLQSPVTDEENLSTPTSLTSALSAFKSAGSRRREMQNDPDEMDYLLERQTAIDAEKARQQRIRDKVPGRRTTGKARTGDIDAVLEQVKDGWEFIIDPDFNHVDLALQLLDDSSHGKDMNSFQRTKDMLGKALKGSVDSVLNINFRIKCIDLKRIHYPEHYQAFAASLPHQAALVGHLSETQTQIHGSRSSLLEAKEALDNKRADLVQLWARGQTLDEMLRLLDQIEHLKSVPDLLETLISEKRLLQAAVLLVRSLKTINKPDMLEIGAVSDLRSYLLGQEMVCLLSPYSMFNSLRDILVDEMQNHLYLKSFWCDARWAAYTPNQQSFPKLEFEEDGKSFDVKASTPTTPSFQLSRQTRFLSELAIKPNEPPIDLSDLSVGSNLSSISNLAGTSNSIAINPEVDSFAYIETLLESLAVLGKLGSALDTVAQRLPSEIYNLMETTISEVEERAEYGRRRTTEELGESIGRTEAAYTLTSENMGQPTPNKGGYLRASSLRLAALESSSKKVDHEILRDLFWTAYSKLDAVAQGLRIVYEVANRIGSRRDFKDSSGTAPGSLFPLAEIWFPVQSEVRTLIYDYLTDEDQGTVSGRNPISSINEILRDGKFTRDRSKAVFRFSDTNVKTTAKTLKPHEDGLTRVLNETMPGLVSGSGDTGQTALASVGNDDRILGTDQHHRLIIRPNVFHVSILFQPTLAFLSRISAVLPFGAESEQASSTILDDFVSKVYLPQLEEKVSELFHQAVTGPDAFQPDPLAGLLSAEPLVKASTELMALINSLCAMLATSPFHREDYTRLILGVIIQFYQRCSDRFQDLVTLKDPLAANLDPQLTLAAQWAQRLEVNTCLSELLNTSDNDDAKILQLCRQETNLELQLLGRRGLAVADLIPSVRNLASLATLYRSVSWFTAELNDLKGRPDDTLSPTSPQTLEPLSAATPYTSFVSINAEQTYLRLPLSREMSISVIRIRRFQALLKTYEQLYRLILDSIRIDIRCRTIYYINSSTRLVGGRLRIPLPPLSPFALQGNYSISCDATEPDPRIADLNAELAKCHLMEDLLIANARHLHTATHFGFKKIHRNILALQQSIKTLTNDQQNTEFQRAKQYYSLFLLSPQELLDAVRKKAIFSFEEYQTMLKLLCGVDPADGEAGTTVKAIDRNYSMYMIELHGLELESSGE